jgi:hypothetical protein
VAGILHYQAIDDRGVEILDELEERRELSPRRLPAEERAYYIAAKGEVDLDPALTEIDSGWELHIARLTAR